jgi:CheY-like chemotaxis protein
LLCIEDNPANLRLIERILARRPDIRLLTASAPGLGLELALAHRPALILLDINLPDMDGYDGDALSARERRHPRHPSGGRSAPTRCRRIWRAARRRVSSTT